MKITPANSKCIGNIDVIKCRCHECQYFRKSFPYITIAYKDFSGLYQCIDKNGNRSGVILIDFGLNTIIK